MGQEGGLLLRISTRKKFELKVIYICRVTIMKLSKYCLFCHEGTPFLLDCFCVDDFIRQSRVRCPTLEGLFASRKGRSTLVKLKIYVGGLTIIQIELEFGNVGFYEGRKTGVPGEKPSEQRREPTTNSTHI